MASNKFIAEAFGTATLVLLGCGSAVLPTGVTGTTAGSLVAIAGSFGLALVAIAYAIGPISGAHVNPAVTLGFLSSGRIGTGEAIGYIISQFIGGIIGAGILYLILSNKIGVDTAAVGLGQNGWGPGVVGGYDIVAAIIAELFGTFLFVYLILQVTSSAVNAAVAGLIIGLTLFVIHLVFINVTGVSVNPARSLGPAVFVGGQAIAQVWLFLIVPAIGGILAGLVHRAGSASTAG